MARLDIGEALNEGFKLVGRRPLDPLVWGLTYFVLAVVPMFLIFALTANDMASLMQASLEHQGFANPQMFVERMKIQALQPLIMVATMVGRAVVYAAIFRAVLTPGDRGFFYLRFSVAELWVGVVILVQTICLWSLMVALIVPVVIFWIPTMIAGAHNSFAGWEIPLGVLACIAAAVVLVWLCLRFSMAVPMSFAAKEFRLFESWGLTRGHALGLFGLYLVVGLVIGLVALVVELVVVAIAIAIIAGAGISTAGVEAFMRQPPQTIVAAIAPYFIVAAALGSLLTGVIMALFIAPWARAYAQLAGEPAVAA